MWFKLIENLWCFLNRNFQKFLNRKMNAHLKVWICLVALLKLRFLSISVLVVNGVIGFYEFKLVKTTKCHNAEIPCNFFVHLCSSPLVAAVPHLWCRTVWSGHGEVTIERNKKIKRAGRGFSLKEHSRLSYKWSAV